MKLVLIAYNEAIDDEVMEQLNAVGIEGYTKWTEVLGKGQASGPHLLSHIWPKGNHALVVVTEDASAEKLLEAIRGIRKATAKEGVKAFLLPVEQVT